MLRAAFEAVVGPVGGLAGLDLAIQLIALVPWTSFHWFAGPLVMVWYLILAVAVVSGLPLAIMCWLCEERALRRLGSAVALLTVINMGRFCLAFAS